MQKLMATTNKRKRGMITENFFSSYIQVYVRSIREGVNHNHRKPSQCLSENINILFSIL